MTWINVFFSVAGVFALPPLCRAGEGPFFITYTHQMEEPGNLEFATKNVVGNPNAGNRFLGTTAEFEYGVKGWWTSELYLDGQATGTQSALFTGYRWENRFRPLSHEHWISPVLYLEFENINGADKSHTNRRTDSFRLTTRRSATRSSCRFEPARSAAE